MLKLEKNMCIPGLHKIKSGKNLSMCVGGTHEVPPPDEQLLIMDGCWQTESQFLQRNDLWETTHTPADGPTSIHMRVALRLVGV